MKRVWSYGNRGYYSDPPERPEPEYIDDTEEIILDLDAVITMDENGNWEYEDTDYPWARSKERNSTYWWTESDRYPTMPFVTYDEVVEYTDELLDPLLPFKAGKYHIKGTVKLVFSVEGVELYSEYIGDGSEDYSDRVYEEEYVSDNADIDFDYDDSSIENFEIEEL